MTPECRVARELHRTTREFRTASNLKATRDHGKNADLTMESHRMTLESKRIEDATVVNMFPTTG
jgi:hypothetical protein